MYQKGIKRLLDVVLSACGLLVLSPLLLLLCLAIKLDSPGPVFFKQKRVGIHKSYFNILKFRTMRIDTPHDMPTHLLHDPEQYITRVGRFLRKTSLDELPQLWNILVGDMAVIGPRPALWNQYDLLAERDKYGANDVRPDPWPRRAGDHRESEAGRLVCGAYELLAGRQMLLRHHQGCGRPRRRGGGRHRDAARRRKVIRPFS